MRISVILTSDTPVLSSISSQNNNKMLHSRSRIAGTKCILSNDAWRERMLWGWSLKGPGRGLFLKSRKPPRNSIKCVLTSAVPVWNDKHRQEENSSSIRKNPYTLTSVEKWQQNWRGSDIKLILVSNSPQSPRGSGACSLHKENVGG